MMSAVKVCPFFSFLLPSGLGVRVRGDQSKDEFLEAAKKGDSEEVEKYLSDPENDGNQKTKAESCL